MMNVTITICITTSILNEACLYAISALSKFNFGVPKLPSPKGAARVVTGEICYQDLHYSSNLERGDLIVMIYLQKRYSSLNCLHRLVPYRPVLFGLYHMKAKHIKGN